VVAATARAGAPSSSSKSSQRGLRVIVRVVCDARAAFDAA
jgi:hypothetical protein